MHGKKRAYEKKRLSSCECDRGLVNLHLYKTISVTRNDVPLFLKKEWKTKKKQKEKKIEP